MNKFLDQIALLITGLICAFMAWCFWYFLGEHAMDAFILLVMLGLMADNFRLKKALRESNQRNSERRMNQA